MKSCFVSEIMPERMLIELKKHGISPIRLPHSDNLTSELKYHPDILCSYFDNILYCEESVKCKINIKAISVNGIRDKYPYDCILNNLITDKYIITGIKTAQLLPYSGEKQLITVPQGYVKCSTIMLNDSAYITSDKTIYRAIKSIGYDVLFVSADCIKLNGYSNGFIGGCAGVMDDKIYFTGNVSSHTDYQLIKTFTDKYNFEMISLSNDDLYDYGGIIEISN